MSVSTAPPTGIPDDVTTPAAAATLPVEGDPIAIIRRRPHPPMVGDFRWDRRLVRALSGRRSNRSAR